MNENSSIINMPSVTKDLGLVDMIGKARNRSVVQLEADKQANPFEDKISDQETRNRRGTKASIIHSTTTVESLSFEMKVWAVVYHPTLVSDKVSLTIPIPQRNLYPIDV